MNSSFFIYHNCKLVRLSLFKISSLWKGKLPWSFFFFAFETWKIKEKLLAKLGRINSRTTHSWLKKNKNRKCPFTFQNWVSSMMEWFSNELKAREAHGARKVLVLFWHTIKTNTYFSVWWPIIKAIETKERRLTNRLFSCNQLLMTFHFSLKN